MNIKYNNNEELRQILNILISLGYKFHGEDFIADTVINLYGSSGYNNLVVGKGSDDSYLALYYDLKDSFDWHDNFLEIMVSLKNFKIQKEKGIIIEDVGDYTATVKKNEVVVNGEHIDKVDLESLIKSVENYIPDFSVYTANDEEHKTYMAMLYGLGYNYHGKSSFEYAHEIYKEYPYTIFRNGYIYGNPKNTDTVNYIFGKDLNTIYDNLSKASQNKNIANIGEYKVTIGQGSIYVGCQTISLEKLKEIYDVMIKLND